MKNKYIILIFLALLGLKHAKAQGGFGGFGPKYDAGSNGGILLFGGGGAWQVDKNFHLGGRGLGSINSYPLGVFDGNEQSITSLGYGGLVSGYTHAKKIGSWQWGFESLFGSGGFTANELSYRFMVIEPSLALWKKLNHFMHLNITAGYRFTIEESPTPFGERKLNMPFIQAFIYFGYRPVK
ncbi:MAG: hypothetical protein LAT68_01220 [Cyclobacteriaceae bacterium]|nr:hypothetical protein [Cyclobacteriaceae bacterium]MCH8514923.1 hypothetical protein [Cyclobacteriaceae bacterium]